MLGVRNGYLAIWQGQEYEASPAPDGIRLYRGNPADGFSQVAEGRYVRVVPASEAELRYVQTTCSWRDARFVVLGAYESWLRVECLDEAAVAEALGLERFDEDAWQGWAPYQEVTDLREFFT